MVWASKWASEWVREWSSKRENEWKLSLTLFVCNFLNNGPILNLLSSFEPSKYPLSNQTLGSPLTFLHSPDYWHPFRSLKFYIRVQKGQRRVDGCTFGQRRLRGFQQYKKIENQTIIKEVTRVSVSGVSEQVGKWVRERSSKRENEWKL